MAVTLTKIPPYSGGLCKYCLNLLRVQNYKPSSDEQEGVARLQCSAIPELIFSSEKTQEYLGNVTVDEQLTLLTLDTNISNCNKFIPAVIVTIDTVSYDGVNLTINYTLSAIVGAPDLNFYFVSDPNVIGTVSPATTGSNSLVIPLVLADGDYYLYGLLSTTEMSIIYPFTIATT